MADTKTGLTFEIATEGLPEADKAEVRAALRAALNKELERVASTKPVAKASHSSYHSSVSGPSRDTRA